MDNLDEQFKKISLDEDTNNKVNDNNQKRTDEPAIDVSEASPTVPLSDEDKIDKAASSKTKVQDDEKCTKKTSKSPKTKSDKQSEDDDKATLESIAQSIKDGTCKNIIFMVGAGISTSVGIPDFRTKGSGLFDKLQKYNLPFKEAIFDIGFFLKNPKPFFALSRELLPGNFQPSLCHFFMTLLSEKDRLLRCYTQNIDGLERVAGMPAEKLVESHGTFHSSHCINRKCRQEYSLEWMKNTVLKPEPEDNIPKCEKCDHIVKPDITFYGEMLPDRFYDLLERDFLKCDLLIILGTSLTVQPFASLAQMIRPDVKRLMINLTKPSDIDWDSKKNKRNVFLKMETDKGSEKLAELLEWKEELMKLYDDYSRDNAKKTENKDEKKPEVGGDKITN